MIRSDLSIYENDKSSVHLGGWRGTGMECALGGPHTRSDALENSELRRDDVANILGSQDVAREAPMAYPGSSEVLEGEGRSNGVNMEVNMGFGGGSCTRIGFWNGRGLRRDDVTDVMQSMGLDILFLCETWARPDSCPPDARYALWSPNLASPDRSRPNFGAAAVLSTSFQRDRFRIVSIHPGRALWIIVDDTYLIGFVYIAPSSTKEEMFTLLTPPVSNVEKVLICGDLNARLGSITNGTATSSRGTWLLEWMEEHNFSIADADWSRTFVGHGSSVIDLVLTNFDGPAGVHIGTHPFGSDHLPVSFVLPMADVPSEPRQHVRFRMKRLKSRHGRAEYETALEELNREILDYAMSVGTWNQRSIDTLEIYLHEGIYGALYRHIGVASDALISRLRNGRICQLLRRRREAYRRGDTPDYHMLCRELELARKEERNRRFQVFTTNLHHMSPTEQAKILHSLKRKRERGRPSPLGHDEGSLTSYASYFSGMYTRRDFQSVPSSMFEPDMSKCPCPFTQDDIYRAMIRMPKGKAPGASGLRSEYLSPALLPSITVLFSVVWHAGIIPSSWSVASIVPIPKKGELTLIENYRPISLTETFRKLYERTLLPAITSAIEPLDLYQGGFRSRRGTIDQIASLQETISVYQKGTRMKEFLCFLDIKAAYDSVDRQILFRKLVARGMNYGLVRAVFALFENNQSRVVMGNRSSPLFRNEVGLLQGSILSPSLYSLFIDDLATKLRPEGCVHLNGQRMCAFFYADDIALFATTETHLDRLLQVCEEHSILNNYRFAPNKCEVISPFPLTAKLYGSVLPVVPTFYYLGVPFSINGISWKDLFIRLTDRAKRAANLFVCTGYNSGGFTPVTNKILYTTFLRPAMEYGLALCPKVSSYVQILERTQCLLLRLACGARRSTNGAWLRLFFGVPSMAQRRDELATRWSHRLETFNETFLVYHAKRNREMKDRVSKRTCFGHCCSRPRDGHSEHCMNATTVAIHRMDLEKLWETCFKEARTVVREMDRQISRGTGHEALKSLSPAIRPSRILQSLSTNVKDRNSLKTLLRWMARGSFGEPQICRSCNIRRLTESHVQECLSVDIDAEIRSGHWSTALEWIADVTRVTTGRSLNVNLTAVVNDSFGLDDG